MFELIDSIEPFRNKNGLYKSSKGDKFGLFFIPLLPGKPPMKVLAAPENSEWQHVSVSYQHRSPTWKEMCFIKNCFWREDETVIQFHPPRSEYVNNHPNCLHLWRNTKTNQELPPSILVGVKEIGELNVGK